MHLLYDIGIFFYGIGIRIASLFNPKAKDWIKGRKDLFRGLPLTNKDIIWFHCASLGEFDQGLPLMFKIKEEWPDKYLLVTFFSPSGMNFHHKRKHPADHVMYLPLDTRSNARKFIGHFQPKMAFFVKYEFWANYIFEAKRIDCKLYNISGIFRKDHRFFKWYGGFFRKTLRQFDWFFVQNDESKELLNSIGIAKVSVSGDSRIDRVKSNKRNAVTNVIISEFKGDDELLIIGSSWPEDEKILTPWILQSKYKVLIAPHNIDEAHIKKIMDEIPESIRYTQSRSCSVDGTHVMILDTIGQLSNAYSYGNIAYVGGGFSGSLHNILEPAVFGIPVIFGPKHERFPEGQQFIDSEFGYSVKTTAEFEKAFNQAINESDQIEKRIAEFFSKNGGSTDHIWTHITSS